MANVQRQVTVWFLIVMAFTPCFLLHEVQGASPSPYSPITLSNTFYTTDPSATLEFDSKVDLVQQKVSLKFQELMRTHDLAERVTCLILLQNQPTKAVANQLKMRLLLNSQAALRKAIFLETRAQVRPGQDTLSSQLRSLGGRILDQYTVINALLVELPLAKLADVAALPQVARIEPDYQLKIELEYSQPIVLNTTPPGWDYSYNGSGIVVAVCDTGIDDLHPALVGRVINESSFVAGEPADDLDGHGTHVAGIIASTDSTDTGIGINISLVNVKIMDVSGTGDTSNLIAGIEWLLMNTSHTADVINLSAGTSSIVADGDSSISKFLDAIVESYNIVWVNAAGNSGSSGIEVPGDSINCISVANFDDNNNPDPSTWGIASSSSKGPTADGRTKPDIAAPGTSIHSCNYAWEGVSSDFVYKSGTSMAAPHVAGAAALVLEYLQKNHNDLQASHALLTKGLLIHTALDLGSSGWNSDWGYGALDLGCLWNFLQAGTFEVDALTPSYSIAKYMINLTSAQTINLTLIWDRQASTDFFYIYYSELANLNLRLQTANGTQIASAASAVNNIEQLSYNATAGVYYLFVDVLTFQQNERQTYVLLSDTPLSLVEKIHTWTFFEIIIVVAVVGIIAIIAIYLVLWYRDRNKKPAEPSYESYFQETPAEEDTTGWPEWPGNP